MAVMMDLTGEVSGGAAEVAKNNLERMLRHCSKPLNRQDMEEVAVADLEAAREKSSYNVTHEMVR